MAELLVASLIWAFSFGLISRELSGLDPAFVGWARLACTLPVFVPLLRLRGLSASTLRRLIAIGAVQYGIAYGAYLYAYRFLQSHQVALMTIFTPLLVALVDGWQTRRLDRSALGLSMVAVVGAGIIEYRSGSWTDAAIGFALMQVANFCFAWGQVAYRDLRRTGLDRPDHTVFGLLFVGGVVVTGLTTTIFGDWTSARQVDGRSLATLAYLGVIASGLGFFLWNRGAVKVSTSTLAVLNNAKAPLAVAVSLLVFGERTDLVRLAAGGGLMLVATVLARRTGLSVSEPASGTPPAPRT